MAPVPKSQEKKQKSLTSFFTPKTVNGLAASYEQQAQKRAAQAALSAATTPNESTLPSRKRPLEGECDETVDDLDTPVKRSKNAPRGEAQSAFFPSESIAVDSTTNATRAQRYLYGSSNPQNDVTTSENDDGEGAKDRRKNEELHRKFVKKLGHPDAMAWRNSKNQDDAAVGDEDDADADPDEEEAPAPAKSGKKKGSKTGKLTPMEVQFLDIKRKHLDTVLIVEVGYKFRFFGEDARIAAKELSIVCIPGKMRYDERRYHPIHPKLLHI